MKVFSEEYPIDYPEPISIVLAKGHGLTTIESIYHARLPCVGGG
jgi:hypothetical protein